MRKIVQSREFFGVYFVSIGNVAFGVRENKALSARGTQASNNAKRVPPVRMRCWSEDRDAHDLKCPVQLGDGNFHT